MKKLIYPVLLTLFAINFVSCKKQKSSDLPLPVSRKEAVYIATNNNNLISYNPNSGVKQWEVHFNGASEGVPVMYKKKLYVVTNTGYFYEIDIIKGEITLEKNISGVISNMTNKLSIAQSGDRLFVPAKDSLFCLDLTGNKVWAYRPNTGNVPTSSPQVVNGHVYLGMGDQLIAVNESNGAYIWDYPTSADITSSPRVSNGLVYFGSEDKNIYALNESNGSIKWQYTTNDKIHMSSPIVYGGMCIVGSYDFGIYCIDTTSPSFPPNGELRWKFPTTERIASSPTVHSPTNTILIGGYDYNLYAIDHVSGTLKWKYPAGSIIQSSPLVYGDYIYFTALDRYLYCVDARNGGIRWKSFLSATTESSPMADDLKTGLYPGCSGMSQY